VDVDLSGDLIEEDPLPEPGVQDLAAALQPGGRGPLVRGVAAPACHRQHFQDESLNRQARGIVLVPELLVEPEGQAGQSAALILGGLRRQRTLANAIDPRGRDLDDGALSAGVVKPIGMGLPGRPVEDGHGLAVQRTRSARFGVSAAKDETEVAMLMGMLRQRKARRVGGLRQRQGARMAVASNRAVQSYRKLGMPHRVTPLPNDGPRSRRGTGREGLSSEDRRQDRGPLHATLPYHPAIRPDRVRLQPRRSLGNCIGPAACTTTSHRDPTDHPPLRPAARAGHCEKFPGVRGGHSGRRKQGFGDF